MSCQNCLYVCVCVSVFSNEGERSLSPFFILGRQMPFQDVLGVSGQRVRKVNIKLHHQVPPLLWVFWQGETLSGNSLSHARLDDIRDLHVARLPVYRGNSN